MIYLQLFICFLQVGLFSVGGGYAAIPIIQGLVVEQYEWLSLNEFSNLVTIAEMTPGPIAINAATFVGAQICGSTGAVIATAGSVLPSCVIVSGIAILYKKCQGLQLFQRVLAALRAAVVALIASSGLTILLEILKQAGEVSFMTGTGINWIAGIIFSVACILYRKGKMNPIFLMLLCGGFYVVMSL